MTKRRGHGRKKAVLVNSASSIIRIAIQITFLVWINQYLLKRIPAEEYALFPLVMSLVVFAELFKNIFTGGLGRFVVEADAKGDDEGVTAVVSSMYPFIAGAAVILGGIGILAVWKIDQLLRIDPSYLGQARWMFSLVLCSMVLGVLTGPFMVGLYAKQRFVTKNLLDLGAELLRIGILTTLLFTVSTSVIWLVVASTIAQFARMLAGVGFTRRLMPAVRFRPSHFSRERARSILGFGAWTTVGGVVNVVSRTVPLLFLNRFGTAVDLTCFHVGRLPDMQLRKLIAAGLVPLQPALTGLYARSGSGSLAKFYFQGNRYILWMALASIAPLLIFAKPIMNAYIGGMYADAALVMALLLGRYPLIFSSAMFYRVAHASGKVSAFYISEIVIQAFTLAGLYYAVVMKGWGAVGAALAISVAAGVLQVLLTWPLGLRLVERGWGEFFRKTLIRGLPPFIAALLVCWGFRELFEMDSWMEIAAGGFCSLVVYGLVIWLFGLDPDDRRLVDQVVTQMRSKFGGSRDLSSANEGGAGPAGR